MAFEYNHDMHIHTRLSPCSGDDGQTCERILDYAVQNGLDTVAVTDHFWDSAVAGASSWYKPLNYEHVSRSLPLPKNDTVRFLFGCETDMDMQGNIRWEKWLLLIVVIILNLQKNITMIGQGIFLEKTVSILYKIF